MSGISVKTGFLWIGITFLEESLMLIQESRKVKLIISRKRNWPVRCLGAVKGDWRQREIFFQGKHY